jgi:transposase
LVEDFLLYTEGLPRDEVARIAGVNLATIRRWERNGARKIHRTVERRLRAHMDQSAPWTDHGMVREEGRSQSDVAT